MATSTCANCDGTEFELKPQRLSGANFLLNFVQCASCGNVIHVMEEHNIGEILYKLEDRLIEIGEMLKNTTRRLD